MPKLASFALFGAGVALIIVGVHATNSFAPDLFRFLTGTLTDKAIWMLLGGIAACLISLMTFRLTNQDG